MVANIACLIIAGVVSIAFSHTNEFESKKIITGRNDQDTLKQYSYEIKSNKEKSMDSNTGVFYSYLNPNGSIQKLNYQAEADSINSKVGQTKTAIENPGNSVDSSRNVLNQETRTKKNINSANAIDAIPTEDQVTYKNYRNIELAPHEITRLVAFPNVYYPLIYFPLIDYLDVPTYALAPKFYQAFPQVGDAQQLVKFVLKGDENEYNHQYFGKNLHGEYDYGYTNKDSAKFETKSSDGITRGAYSYWDSNGKLQSVSYEAGKDMGFKVMATNLPKTPVQHL